MNVVSLFTDEASAQRTFSDKIFSDLLVNLYKALWGLGLSFVYIYTCVDIYRHISVYIYISPEKLKKEKAFGSVK